MTWLFACFGYPNKRKRLKSSYRVHSQPKVIGRYQPLESPSSCLPEVSNGENTKPIRSNLKRRRQGKDRERKKVRFDLNVIAHEAVQGYDNNDDDDDLRSILAAAKWGEENEEDNIEAILERGNSTCVERACTFTYRYSNCVDNDELGSELEDDLSDEEDEEVSSKSDDLSRSRSLNPVLLPIENLNQWRVIKMKKWETVA